MKYTIFTSIVLLFIVSCNDSNERKISPVHSKNFDTLTTYEELQDFINLVSTKKKYIKYKVGGISEENREIPLLEIYGAISDTANLMDILIVAQQHGDEPAGKEGVTYYIEQLANNEIELPKNIRLIVMPCINPDGAEIDQRTNINDVDLNRDHVTLYTSEIQTLHKVFQSYLPEVAIDIHEYEYYSKFYEKWGYYKNTDILVGGLTNPNVDKKLIGLFYEKILPNAGNALTKKGYSYGEYMLGEPFVGKVMGTSTVNIFDGRQSLGIMGTLSMIVEGRYGLNSNDNLQRRTKSQYEILKGIIENCAINARQIQKAVHGAREKIINDDSVYVDIRYTREKSKKPYHYKMVSKSSGNDTVFIIKGFYPKVSAVDSVRKPEGYLVAASDTNLVSWLNRNQVHYTDYTDDGDEIYQNVIKNKKQLVNMEGTTYWNVLTSKKKIEDISNKKYLFVPTNQLQSFKLIISLEPESELALHNYKEFTYLLDHNIYPIYRIE